MGYIQPILIEQMPKLHFLCKKYEVEELYLFGSATGSAFSEKSDLDFLVQFSEIPITEYADYFFDFMHELEHFYGRKIDLLTPNSLTNPYLTNSINRSKQLLYERRNQEIPA